MLVQLTEGSGDFELSVGEEGKLVLRGPQDRVRNTYGSESKVVRSLWQHARQRALLQLRGERGADFTNNETLSVSLVPAARQKTGVTGVWEHAEPNAEQIVPLGYVWNLRVALPAEAPMPLLIGALVLSTDGSVIALPKHNRKVRLQPGETLTFNARRERLVGSPPLDVQVRVLVFGTQLQHLRPVGAVQRLHCGTLHVFT